MENFEKYFEKCLDIPNFRGKGASQKNYDERVKKAKEQVRNMKPTKIEYVEECVLNFLKDIGVELGYRLKDKGDFIWLKFTKDNYLGVVAAGADFNFSYDKGSGRFVEAAGKEWNTEVLLVFPISKYPEGKGRKDIERAVGNYLIDKGVAIIDYYSHNYPG